MRTALLPAENINKAQLIRAVTTYTTPRFGDLSFLIRRLELTSNEQVPPDDTNNQQNSIIHPHVILDDKDQDQVQQCSATTTRILPMVSDPDLTTM
jgi:hypothetical protein